MSSFFLGIDIGGSHFSGAIFSTSKGCIVEDSYCSIAVQSNIRASEFITHLDVLIKKILFASRLTVHDLEGIGIAVPGPFNYDKGVSHIYGVHKWDSLFGFNIAVEIKKIIKTCPVYFINDAESFALGEYNAGAAMGSAKSILLTFGSGFGSTFLDKDVVQIIKSDNVPENGYLYNIPFKEGIADDYFSTRWFVKTWGDLGREKVTSANEIALLAAESDADALRIFDAFADNFIEFITPWVHLYKPHNLILGGGIARGNQFFISKIQSFFSKISNTKISICRLWDKAAIVGAAMHAKNNSHKNNMLDESFNWRKTEQFLAPARKDVVNSAYEAYPSFSIGNGKIHYGAKALARWISGHKNVVIDGYDGVFWDTVVESLDAELSKLGLKTCWFHADAAMKTEEELEQMLVSNLGGDNPLFGKITEKDLIDWFDTKKLKNIKPDKTVDVNIVIGSGAALVGWDGPLIYFDLPKNEIQFRARAGKATNLGVKNVIDNRRTYKRFFFIDWVVLNKHKSNVLSSIDIIVDEQRPDEYLFMNGEDLRAGLTAMATNAFRPRPWFEPGAWGGSWMKEHMEGLNTEVSNLAWSFELMVLENGLLFESDGYLLEVSFDFIMFNNYKDVLGDCAETFKYDFPIRFDFLDTFDGGNLSIQCHPSPDYIKEHFGMPFTQDETYYIMDCKEDPVVYLGFQEGIKESEFHNALLESQQQVKELEVVKYIQKFEAKKHNLYLIPHGTIHASGSNNLVLEVSSAPYIFTFKMYDWLRLDLDGKPRPINIEHGMKNVNFNRKGASVATELISQPYVITQNDDYTLEHMPTHADHFYDVHRYSIINKVHIKTNNKCHVWMLVEGQSIELVTENGHTQIFNYAETFVIPASAKSYTITNKSKNSDALLVKSFIK